MFFSRFQSNLTSFCVFERVGVNKCSLPSVIVVAFAVVRLEKIPYSYKLSPFKTKGDKRKKNLGEQSSMSLCRTFSIIEYRY